MKDKHAQSPLPMKTLSATKMKWTSVGMGTWNMERKPTESIRALRHGLDLGANHIDTAEMYGDGRVEEIVGEAIRGRRHQVNLVSKVLPSHAQYQDALRACERSLKRLNTDFLDLYLLHWRNAETPIEEMFRAFEKLKQDGKIRYWGLSNFDLDEMKEAVRMTGEGKIACNQVLYHIWERAIEFDLMPWCKDHKIPIVAYSPLGQNSFPSNPVLESMALEHKATPAQIILAFLLRDPNVFSIPKSSNVYRTEENVRAMNIRLSQEDINKLDQEFPSRSRKTLPML